MDHCHQNVHLKTQILEVKWRNHIGVAEQKQNDADEAYLHWNNVVQSNAPQIRHIHSQWKTLL